MKKLALFVTLIMLMSMQPAKKTRIVFFGDSITEMGAGPGGYIDRLQKFVNTKGWQAKYELLGAGIGGNKVYDLYLRLESDVLDKNPDKVLIYVGINDVWHKTSLGTGTDADKFERFYIALIKKLQARKIDVFLCTPTVIGERKDKANPQDKDLDAYADIIRKLAKEQHCTLIDLRKSFNNYELASNKDNAESGILTTDRVHLNDKGNQLVADEIAPLLFKP